MQWLISRSKHSKYFQKTFLNNLSSFSLCDVKRRYSDIVIIVVYSIKQRVFCFSSLLIKYVQKTKLCEDFQSQSLRDSSLVHSNALAYHKMVFSYLFRHNFTLYLVERVVVSFTSCTQYLCMERCVQMFKNSYLISADYTCRGEGVGEKNENKTAKKIKIKNKT